MFAMFAYNMSAIVRYMPSMHGMLGLSSMCITTLQDKPVIKEDDDETIDPDLRELGVTLHEERGSAVQVFRSRRCSRTGSFSIYPRELVF